MHFSAMYRLRCYRRAFTRKGGSSKCRVGECVELIQTHSPGGATTAEFCKQY